MTFTYDLAGAGDTLIIAKIRLLIGDVTESKGVKPNKQNFTDEELLIMYVDEANDIGRGAARACEILSRMWTIIFDITVGPHRAAANTVANKWADRAEELRSEYGGGSGSLTFGNVHLDFSADLPSE